MAQQDASNNTLSVRLKLWVKEQLWDEAKIIANIDDVIELVEVDSFDLLRTDGAVSILYNGEELLGDNYITDVHLILNDIFFSLNRLVNGNTVERSLPGSSSIVQLSVDNDNVNYMLRLVGDNYDKFYIHREMPTHLFIVEYAHFYLRNARLFKRLGEKFKTYNDRTVGENEIVGHDFDLVLNAWKEHVPLSYFSPKDIDELEKMLKMPLDLWINRETR